MKYEDLYSFLGEKVNFHEKIKGDPKSMTWNCKDFAYVEDFCKLNKLDTNKLKKILNENGAFCDCEVLFNTTRCIDENKDILLKGGK
jgi:hypothetical protein